MFNPFLFCTMEFWWAGDMDSTLLHTLALRNTGASLWDFDGLLFLMKMVTWI